MASSLPLHMQKAASVTAIQEWISRPLEQQTMRCAPVANEGARGKKSNQSRLQEVAENRVALLTTHREELADWMQRFATYGVAIDHYNNQKLALVSGNTFRSLKDIPLDELPKFPRMSGPVSKRHLSNVH